MVEFIIRNNLPILQANNLGDRPQVLPVRSEAQLYNQNGKHRSETDGTKYYRVQADGTFISLITNNRDDIARVFPQVSSRILSAEELEH